MGDEASRKTLHDLNNLFQVIMGSLELMKRTRQASPETLDTALRATREAALLTQQMLASHKRPAGEAERARPGETVLLVEDDPAARLWAASALESLGYRVLQAADAAAAATLLHSPAQRVDLIFTDVALPGGGVPVLFGADLGKPYDLERLASTVRGVIDSR
jgi:signal transduction histidine kinase